MIKHLESCSEKYDQEDYKGISPISREDCTIITNLIQLLTDTDTDPQIIDILSQWKKIPDTDILEKLAEAPDTIGLIKRPNYYIEIEGDAIQVSSLFSVAKRDGYSIKGNRPEYSIVLNETESPNVYNGNKKIKFTDQDDREVCWQDIKESLSVFTNIRFL